MKCIKRRQEISFHWNVSFVWAGVFVRLRHMVLGVRDRARIE